jgi:GT2 family glycosyltransferase
MDDLDIAVVIVTYKSAQLTINSLASVQSERGTSGLRIRAIVVDNASGDFDALAEAIRTNGWSSWVTLILAPRNGGFAYGNNLGLERAYEAGAPSYVYLLNPDTEVRPGAIKSLALFLESHSEVGIAGSSIEDPDGSDWPIAFRFPTLVSEVSAGLEVAFLRRWEVARHMSKTPEPVDWICGASMMIRPALFAAIGGLDENYFLYFEETDFCFRAKKAGYQTWYYPESRIMHIVGQSTNVIERRAEPKRLPAYWFESRRRYFVVSFGVRQAVFIDIASLAAHWLGWLKRVLLGRRRTAIPYLIRDLLRHSVLWQRNRHVPPSRTFRPSA